MKLTHIAAYQTRIKVFATIDGLTPASFSWHG